MSSRKKRNIRYRADVRHTMNLVIFNKYYPNQKRRHKIFKSALKADCKKYRDYYSKRYKRFVASDRFITVLWGCAAMRASANKLSPKELIVFKDKDVAERMKVWEQKVWEPVNETENCEKRNG